jgi:hypothetical protein
MPAPTRMTSGSLAARFSIMGLSNQRDIWHELPAYVSSGFEADIRIRKMRA